MLTDSCVVGVPMTAAGAEHHITKQERVQSAAEWLSTGTWHASDKRVHQCPSQTVPALLLGGGGGGAGAVQSWGGPSLTHGPRRPAVRRPQAPAHCSGAPLHCPPPLRAVTRQGGRRSTRWLTERPTVRGCRVRTSCLRVVACPGPPPETGAADGQLHNTAVRNATVRQKRRGQGVGIFGVGGLQAVPMPRFYIRPSTPCPLRPASAQVPSTVPMPGAHRADCSLRMRRPTRDPHHTALSTRHRAHTAHKGPHRASLKRGGGAGGGGGGADTPDRRLARHNGRVVGGPTGASLMVCVAFDNAADTRVTPEGHARRQRMAHERFMFGPVALTAYAQSCRSPLTTGGPLPSRSYRCTSPSPPRPTCVLYSPRHGHHVRPWALQCAVTGGEPRHIGREGAVTEARLEGLGCARRRLNALRGPPPDSPRERPDAPSGHALNRTGGRDCPVPPQMTPLPPTRPRGIEGLPLCTPPSPRRCCWMQVLNAARHEAMQCNKVRPKSSSVTLPWAPFAFTPPPPPLSQQPRNGTPCSPCASS